MKKLSIKMKLTLWFTIFMVIIGIFVLGFMLIISDRIISGEAHSRLYQTVWDNLSEVSLENGALHTSDGFAYYKDGVSTLIYNSQGALLAGQVPLTFTSEPAQEPFQNGLTRQIQTEEDAYYILDLRLQSGWEDGIWLRGVLPVSGDTHVVSNVLKLSFATLPLLIFLAALGGYILAKRAFRPVDAIVRTAEEISEASDLSQRIKLPGGKDELTKLAEAFNSMFERLERSFEAEKQFTSDASHELRTPTAVILAQCGYAEKHAKTPEQYQEALDVIKRQAGKMSLLINQLLSMTRLEQGTQKATWEEADLSELVSIVCREQVTAHSFSGENPEKDKHITLETQIAGQVNMVMDVSLMTRLIQNLVDNAYKYGKEGGRILVSLSQNDSQILLTVEDDGIGISPENLQRIWQRFYQADAARSGKRGLGLGLAMVSQIARLHGGSVSVQSSLGAGSRFTASFPKRILKK